MSVSGVLVTVEYVMIGGFHGVRAIGAEGSCCLFDSKEVSVQRYVVCAKVC